MKRNRIYYLVLSSMLLLLPMFMGSCDKDLFKFEDDSKGSYKPSDGDPIATTLKNSGEFSEWVGILEYTETFPILNALYDGSGTGNKYTMFVPTDSALQCFYTEKNVSSYEELGKEYATALVKSLVTETDSIKLQEKFTATIDYYSCRSKQNTVLSFTVNPGVDGGFLLGDTVVVSYDHVACSNGFYYTIQSVPQPLVESVYDRVNDGKSTIMTEALKATGYDAVLEKVSDTTNVLGSVKVVNYKYTFLNVTDEAFGKSGINSLADLKNSLLDKALDASVGVDSLLKQYVEYHLFKSDYSLSELSEMLTPNDTMRILNPVSTGQILMVYKHVVDSFMTEADTLKAIGYASFNDADTSYVKPEAVCDYSYYEKPNRTVTATIAEKSNILALNGYVHNLSNWMPVYEPQPSTVVWDLADYTEVRNVCQHPTAVQTSETKVRLDNLDCYEVEVGQNGSNNGNYYNLCYVTCKSNLKNCVNFDRVVFNVGYQGSVAMKTPTMVKGKYKVSISMAYLTDQKFIRTSDGCKGGLLKITVDGENQILSAPYTSITKSLAGVYETTLYDELEFTETGSHVFKFVVMDPAASTNSKFYLQFDAITFTPIE